MPLVHLVAGVNVNRFLFVSFLITYPRVSLLVLRDEVTVHPIVLALCPCNTDHIGTLGRRLLTLCPSFCRYCRRPVLFHQVLLILIQDHCRFVLAVSHCRRCASARTFVQGRAGRHICTFALTEALRAEQRRAALRRRRNDGCVRVLAAGQTDLRDIAAGETVRLPHAVAIQFVQDAGRRWVQSRDYLALQTRDLLADTALLQRFSLKAIRRIGLKLIKCKIQNVENVEFIPTSYIILLLSSYYPLTIFFYLKIPGRRQIYALIIA